MKSKFHTIVTIIALILSLFGIGAGATAYQIASTPPEQPVAWSAPEEGDVEARSYGCAVYTEQGCAKYVVAAGGEIEVQSTGVLDVQSGAVFTATDMTMAGVFYPGFSDLTVTDGYTLTAAYTVYGLDSAGAVTITLAACSNDGQLLILIGDDANTITINDTNVRTNDGGVQTIGQYDAITWSCHDTEWIELSDSANS